MGSTFHDLAAVQDEDLVGVCDGGEAVAVRRRLVTVYKGLVGFGWGVAYAMVMVVRPAVTRLSAS